MATTTKAITSAKVDTLWAKLQAQVIKEHIKSNGTSQLHYAYTEDGRDLIISLDGFVAHVIPKRMWRVDLHGSAYKEVYSLRRTCAPEKVLIAEPTEKKIITMRGKETTIVKYKATKQNKEMWFDQNLVNGVVCSHFALSENGLMLYGFRDDNYDKVCAVVMGVRHNG